MKKIKIISFTLLSSLIIGCSAVSPKTYDDGASEIKVDKAKPSNNYEVIGAVTGIDGRGCGSFGYEGSYDRALIDLQNKINTLHGEYGQITTVVKPHLDDGGGCFKNEFEIRAVAYKKAANKPKPEKVIVHVVNTKEEVFTKKMRELKSLLDDKVLTQEEYAKQKAKLLEQGFNAK